MMNTLQEVHRRVTNGAFFCLQAIEGNGIHPAARNPRPRQSKAVNGFRRHLNAFDPYLLYLRTFVHQES